MPVKFFTNTRNWQYWHHMFYYRKTKIPAIKCYPNEYWTWNLRHSGLMLSSLSYQGMYFLGILKLSFVPAALQSWRSKWLRSPVQCSLGQHFVARFFLFSCSKGCDANIALLPTSAILWKTRVFLLPLACWSIVNEHYWWTSVFSSYWLRLDIDVALVSILLL